jgi:undecaprenyl-diphosphatase
VQTAKEHARDPDQGVVSQPATEAAEKVVADAPPEVRREIRRMGGLRALDAALLMAGNRLPHTGVSDQYVTILSDLGRGIGWAAVCGALAIGDGSRGRRVAVRTMAAMLVANALGEGPLKRYFKRRRPFHDVHDHIVVGTRTLDTSFPSGHSASSFAAATSLAAAYPRFAAVFLATAAGVGFSRVYLGHHYPSDVAAGAAVGMALGGAAVAVT